MTKMEKEQAFKNRAVERAKAIDGQEIQKHSRKPGKKRFGLRTTWKYRDSAGKDREWTHTEWYEREKDRENAFISTRTKWPYRGCLKERIER